MKLLKMKYKIYCNFDLDLNFRVLNYLYLPIIGHDAYTLYTWLIQEINVQQMLFKIKSSHERIFLSLGFNENSFTKAKSKLEAMDLLVSRILPISKYDGETYCIYELKQPLKYENFIKNMKYKSLLVNKISLSEFERINLVFKNDSELNDAVNVSSTFEMVYDIPVAEPKIIDINTLQKKVEKQLKAKIFISSEIVNIIETFVRIYNLSIDEIKSKLVNCAINAKNDNPILFHPTMLRNELSTLAESMTQKIELPETLHRNVLIFSDSLSNDEKQKIINDYLSFNCEQYLFILQKTELTDTQKKLLVFLKQKQKLSDSVINLILDYSVYKTYGKINENYLKKIAKSINLLNLKSVYDVLHYLVQITLGIKQISFQNTSVADTQFNNGNRH